MYVPAVATEAPTWLIARVTTEPTDTTEVVPEFGTGEGVSNVATHG